MFNLNTFKWADAPPGAWRNRHAARPPAYVVHAYIAYLLISIPVTVWVGYTLYRNGRAFLVDAFHGNAALADSVNHLLVVGFYLLNIGWIVMTLKTDLTLETPRAAIELLSEKIGTVLLVLGALHLGNVFLFNRVRREAAEGSR